MYIHLSECYLHISLTLLPCPIPPSSPQRHHLKDNPMIRLRQQNSLRWNTLGRQRADRDVNTVMFRGRAQSDRPSNSQKGFLCESDGHGQSKEMETKQRLRSHTLGSVHVISKPSCHLDCHNDPIRFDVSVEHLEKKGKWKHLDMNTYITIYKKHEELNVFVLIYRSSTISSDPNHRANDRLQYPDIVLPMGKILGPYSDRLLRFCLVNGITHEEMGECEAWMSTIFSNDSSSNTLHLKLKESDSHVSVLTRRFSSIGTLKVTGYWQNPMPNLETKNIDRCRSSTIEDERNVIYADGPTQKYLLSLVAPSKNVKLNKSYWAIAAEKFDRLQPCLTK